MSSPIALPPLPEEPVYYEPQRLSRCAMHTLNHLLQFCAFDSARLDAICTSLTPHKWFNPHKSIFGIGNYDVNVLMRALAGYGLTMRWFDRRRDLDQVPLESTFGLILNLPSRTVGVFGARHWLCFKRFASGEWYMIDSDFPASKDPKATPKQKAHRIEDIRAYLRRELDLPAVGGETTVNATAAARVQLFTVDYAEASATEAITPNRSAPTNVNAAVATSPAANSQASGTPSIASNSTPSTPPATLAPPSQHGFRVRPLRMEDMDDLAELGRHTYGGYDYICSKMPHWLAHPDRFVCLAVTYEGEESTATDGPGSASTPLASLRQDAPPVPPRTYQHLDDGRMWEYEEIRITPRPAAASPSPPPEAHQSESKPTSDAAVSPSPPAAFASSASLSSHVHRVISLEVLALFDDGTTGFLQALRVHPAFRGFGLSSLLHARLLHVARSVYHVKRVRETTSHDNNISIYLARKHGLSCVREFVWGMFDRLQAETMLRQVDAQLAFLSGEGDGAAADLPASSSDVDLDLARGPLRRGHSDQVLDLVARHASTGSAIDTLCQYWMVYEPTENNLVYLCSEAVLPPGEIERRRNLSGVDPTRPDHLLCATETPYFLVVSHDSSKDDASLADVSASPIRAFALSLVSRDQVGPLRAFTLYTPGPTTSNFESIWHSANYRHLLLHFAYQLRAALDGRHETGAFKCDDTGRPLAETVFTTAIADEPMHSVQATTPRWFVDAFQRLQTRLDANKDDDGASEPRTTEAALDAAPNASPSADLPPPWTCRILTLEATY